MTKTFGNLIFEVTATAAVVISLTLASFGLREATEPSSSSSGDHGQWHQIDCPACGDPGIPLIEQLKRCPRLMDLHRRYVNSAYSFDAQGPAQAVAARSRDR